MIARIAEQCGITPQTVRRVLNSGLGDITPEEFQKIREAAGELGYGDLNRTHTLAILFEEESGKGLTHTFFAIVLNAFKNEAESRGYDVTFINHQSATGTRTYLEHCLDRNVDGVCMVCGDFGSAGIKELVDSGIPCITVDHFFKGTPAVLSDNETGVRKLCEYAMSLGHKRIAFIHGHNNSIVTRSRISQFCNTMAFHGLEVPEGYLRASLYDDIVLTRTIVKEMLELPEPPTCILLPNDMVYLGAMEAVHQFGLRIPEDISLAGYDGIALTQVLDPPLTTIRQSNEELGRAAAQRLIECIEHPEGASRKPRIFPVELLKGGTIAPPRDI